MLLVDTYVYGGIFECMYVYMLVLMYFWFLDKVETGCVGSYLLFI